MSIQKIETTKFSGGISPFQKVGIEGSFRYSSHTNLHQDPNFITLFPSGSKVTGTTVTGLVKWMQDASPYSTDRYAYDDGGTIYKITSAESWSVSRAGATIGNGAVGQGLSIFDDFLYYATSTTIGRYGRLSLTPSYSDDFLSDGTTNIDQSDTTSTSKTYTLPTSISEAATARQTFTPTRDPAKAIAVNVDTKGTGDWTLTLHDSANTELGSATVANASVSASGFVTFTFTTPARVTIGNDYHFHVVVSTGTSKVVTGTASDLETAQYKEYFGILIADTNFHPMREFLNMLVTGNANYLATWDRALYNPNAITFKPGYVCRALTVFNEFLVAACYKGADVTSTEGARLYFWDGTSSSFNFMTDISMGFPHFIHNKFNKLIGMYGSSGSLNLGYNPFQQVQDVPTLTTNKYVEIYPGAVTEWQTKTYIGVSSATNDTALIQGVYEYGSLNTQFPDVMNRVYTISTGTSTGTGMKIGCVFGIGDTMYVSWKDSTSYGVDKITKGGTSVASGEWESLIFDDDALLKQKEALKLVVRFLPLTTGQSVTPKYKLDRASSWTTGTAASTVGDCRVEVGINKRFNEMEYGFTVASSAGTFPKVTGVYLEYDNLENEISSS